jgi:Pyruvate/2-oxoacid:ferredoxin oxidoreductase delta subunit
METGAEAVNLETFPPIEIDNPDGKILTKIYVSSLVKDVDVLVSIAKLKVHELTLFTGAVKNMFGTIPGRNKSLMHKKAPNSERFSDLLIDLYSKVTPGFAVMDGVICIEGSAGIGGKTRKIGVILASDNPIALDVVASSLIGYDPSELPVNKAAKRRGFVGTSLKEIEILGENLEDVKVVEFAKPPTMIPHILSTSWLNKLRRILSISPEAKPVVDKDKCIGCKICEKKCPVEAIKVDKYPVFTYNICIRCFCCKEGCKEGAIKVKAPMMNSITNIFMRSMSPR